jgi:hypothetical protein
MGFLTSVEPRADPQRVRISERYVAGRADIDVCTLMHVPDVFTLFAHRFKGQAAVWADGRNDRTPTIRC